MMSNAFAIAATEFRILRRNRWVMISTVLLAMFALALTLAGSTNSDAFGVDLLTLSVASMTTLAVYLIPLLALLMGFDAIAGDAERGALALLLTYPMSRGTLLLGKFLAHLAGLSIAITIGLGTSGLVCWALGSVGAESLVSLARLIIGSILLGAFFLALSYGVSAVSTSTAAAAGLAALIWLVLVVLYDLVLLGVVVWDDGGTFSRHVFPWLLAANPADALRLWSVTAAPGQALATGMTGVTSVLPNGVALASLLLWPLAGFGLAWSFFSRRIP